MWNRLRLLLVLIPLPLAGCGSLLASDTPGGGTSASSAAVQTQVAQQVEATVQARTGQGQVSGQEQRR